MNFQNFKYGAVGVSVLGILIFGVGLIYESLELVDVLCGTISGPIIFGIGISVFLFCHFKSKKA